MFVALTSEAAGESLNCADSARTACGVASARAINAWVALQNFTATHAGHYYGSLNETGSTPSTVTFVAKMANLDQVAFKCVAF